MSREFYDFFKELWMGYVGIHSLKIPFSEKSVKSVGHIPLPNVVESNSYRAERNGNGKGKLDKSIRRGGREKEKKKKKRGKSDYGKYPKQAVSHSHPKLNSYVICKVQNALLGSRLCPQGTMTAV